MLSGWLSLVFANQLCGILMRELTASYSACVPSNRSLSCESHLHGRRLCFVGKDFTICLSLCQPTPPQLNLLSFHLSLIFCQTLEHPHDHRRTQTHTQPRSQTCTGPVWSSSPAKKWWCNIINRIMVFKWGVYPQYFCWDFLPPRPQCAPLWNDCLFVVARHCAPFECCSNLVWWILRLECLMMFAVQIAS